MSYTTLASLVRPFWKALQAAGCEPQPVFARAGLDPAKLRDPNARYPDDTFPTLWATAVEVTADPCLGLAVAQHWHPTDAHALGYSWLASDTLLDALERVVRYMRVCAEKDELGLEETAEDYRLWIDNPDPDHPTANEYYDAFCAVLVRLCRLSYGEGFDPLRLAMKRPAPPDPAPFARMFRAPVRFSANENVIHFDKARLREPLDQANPQLAQVNDRVVIDYLAKFDRSRVTMRVRAKLIEKLSSGHATQEGIADALHLSLRSLQRRLKEEGTSYKLLWEDTRRELAIQYVKQAQLSFNEITYLLGFSEPANFSRAFKRWSGCSPSEFRIRG